MLADTTFGAVFSYSRTGTAYDFDASGVLTSYAANAIRSNTSQGWLLEAAATNGVRNPRYEGAAAPSTNPTFMTLVQTAIGVSSSIVGTGTEDGIPYIDILVSGTAASSGGLRINFEQTTSIAAAQNQVWTHSVYLRLVSGTFGDANFQPELREYASGTPSGGLNGALFVPTTAALRTQRSTYTRTLTDATATHVVPTFRIGVVSGSAYNFTLRFGASQCELNYFASSIILPPVSSPAATARSADSLSITGAAFTNLFGGLPARSNLVLQSQTLDNATWSKGNVTISADATADPFGGTTADQIVEAVTVGVFHNVLQNITKAAAATQYTYSAYIKDSGRQVILNLQSSGSNGAVIRFDPSTGTITQAATVFGTGWSGASGSVTAVGGSWYRAVLTATTDALTTLQTQIALYSTGAANSVYTGDGASGCYAVGQQLETGSSATAYIPTTTLAGNAGGPAQGCVIFDMILTAISTAPSRICAVNDGTINNVIEIFFQSNATPVLSSTATGVAGTQPTGSALTTGVLTRIGMRWGSSGMAMCRDGGTVATSVSTLPVGLSQLNIGNRASADRWLNGRVSKVRAYGFAPTDAEFQALCTLGA